MNPTSSQQKKNSENCQNFPDAREPKVYLNEETNLKVDMSKKITASINYTTEENFPSNLIQNTELYQNQNPMTYNSFRNVPSSDEKYVSIPGHVKNLNPKPNLDQDNIEKMVFFPEHGWRYSANSDKNKYEKYDSKSRKKLDKECEGNHICHQKCSHADLNGQIPNKNIIYQNRLYEIAQDSSYICQPVNDKRQTVRINDLIIKDNLVLCCKPRTHRSLYIQPNQEDGRKTDQENIDGYVYPQAKEKLKGDSLLEENNYEPRDDQYHETKNSLDKSGFVRHDSLDLGTSLLLQEYNTINHVNPCEASQMERKIKCAKLSKKFKCCLWALFFISVSLVIVGIILLFHTLIHFMNKNYINIVIEQIGFVRWVWVAMIISLIIIFVGIYGIITSIDRGKRILEAYCTSATIMALIILIFLVFLWLLFANMKDVKFHSMQNTIKMYRCSIYIRNAWDDLQLNHKCCGIENQENWKYIPPSCCNGTTHQEKMDCVGYYINEKQAYIDGCKSKLEEYFFIFFVIAACLLVLCVLLLVLSILASIWLIRSYKKVEKCQEVFYISR